MDAFYNELFNMNDEDDAHYHQIIPNVEVKVFEEILKKDLKIINESIMKVNEWVKFKYELLKTEKEWDTRIFDWKIDSHQLNQKCPYVGINIFWDNLKNKSSRYFQVLMALENVWMGDERLENLWSHIDDNES